MVQRSIRAKVIIGSALPLIVILGILTTVEHIRHRQIVLNDLSLLAAQSGMVIEANLKQAMIESDFSQVQNMLDTFGESEGFDVVYLLDPQGKVIFAPHQEGVGKVMSNQHQDCQPCHRLPVSQRPASIVLTTGDGQTLFRSMTPIENSAECTACHDPAQPLLGLLMIDIPMELVEGSLASDLRENLLWGAGMILVTVVLSNIVMSRFVLTPLQRLAAAITRLGSGDDPQPLPVDTQDEVGRLSAGFNAMARQVHTRNRELQSLSESLQHQSTLRGELLNKLITAQEDERRRIARELHDELGQAMSGLSLRVEAMERLLDPESRKEQQQFADIRALIAETTSSMYDLIFELRPSVLDDMGLVSALRAYAERTLEEAGIAYTLDTQGLTERLPPAMEVTLYRVFQEALTNIIRHADARHVHMEINRQDGCFTGKIVDDGTGFDPGHVKDDGTSSRGFGLMGMKERIMQCGGQLEIVSQPGEGAQILLRIPVDND